MRTHCDYSFWESTFFSLLHLSEKKVRVATAFSDSDVTGKANKLVFVLCGRVYRCRENENKRYKFYFCLSFMQWRCSLISDTQEVSIYRAGRVYSANSNSLGDGREHGPAIVGEQEGSLVDRWVKIKKKKNGPSFLNQWFSKMCLVHRP